MAHDGVINKRARGQMQGKNMHKPKILSPEDVTDEVSEHIADIIDDRAEEVFSKEDTNNEIKRLVELYAPIPSGTLTFIKSLALRSITISISNYLSNDILSSDEISNYKYLFCVLHDTGDVEKGTVFFILQSNQAYRYGNFMKMKYTGANNIYQVIPFRVQLGSVSGGFRVYAQCADPTTQNYAFSTGTIDVYGFN